MKFKNFQYLIEYKYELILNYYKLIIKLFNLKFYVIIRFFSLSFRLKLVKLI